MRLDGVEQELQLMRPMTYHEMFAAQAGTPITLDAEDIAGIRSVSQWETSVIKEIEERVKCDYGDMAKCFKQAEATGLFTQFILFKQEPTRSGLLVGLGKDGHYHVVMVWKPSLISYWWH